MVKNIVLILFLTATVCFAEVPAKGSLSGAWITKEGPMAGAQVLLFNATGGPPPASDKFLRIPDLKTTIDNSGQFTLPVAPGSYYLVMRKRTAGNTIGPPRDGDLQFYSRDQKGVASIFTVKSGKDTDIGTISDATVFNKKQAKFEKGMTAIEGTVTDENDLPFEGARVFAYESPEMKGKPLYASEATTKDGKYLIIVNTAGTYYLKVRNHYGGGKPTSGELMGGYGKSPSPSIAEVRNGTVAMGIDIKIKKFYAPGRPE